MKLLIRWVNLLARKLAENPYISKAPDHPGVLTAIYIPLMSLLLAGGAPFMYQRPWKESLAWIGLGLVLWTLMEYFLHRYMFHIERFEGHWRVLTSERHLDHHGKGGDKFILVPPLGSLLYSFFAFVILIAITRNLSLTLLIEFGMLIGYVVYEWMHYAAHHLNPKTRIGKAFRRYHLQHHFMNNERHFGVTSPFWDFVFGTYDVTENSYKKARRDPSASF